MAAKFLVRADACRCEHSHVLGSSCTAWQVYHSCLRCEQAAAEAATNAKLVLLASFMLLACDRARLFRQLFQSRSLWDASVLRNVLQVSVVAALVTLICSNTKHVEVEASGGFEGRRYPHAGQPQAVHESAQVEVTSLLDSAFRRKLDEFDASDCLANDSASYAVSCPPSAPNFACCTGNSSSDTCDTGRVSCSSQQILGCCP